MIHAPLNMTAPPEVFRRRRAELASAIKRPMVILAGRARARKYATNTHPFRAGSTYLYFGGPPVEGACLLIEPGSDGDAGCSLFRTPSTLDDAVWMGESHSDDALASLAGVRVSAVLRPDELGRRLGDRAGSAICPPCPPSEEWVSQLGLAKPTPDELTVVIDMRLLKDEHELVAMRRAAKIGVEGQLAAMRTTKPGVKEADVAAALLAVYAAHQSEPSFTPIITIHGEVLHGHGYHSAMGDGDLLLVDAGAEEPGGYTSDMTRTYPVNGVLSDLQRRLYDVVLRAEREAIAACVPRARYRDVHDLSARVICEGLVEIGLLKGDPAELAGRGAHTLFFTHGVGHLIGLDVHDMEDFGDLAGYAAGRTRRCEFGNKFLRLDRDLDPGMTVTIEPGIYLVPAIWRHHDLIGPFADCVNRAAVDELLENKFGGIRIEDTVYVRSAEAGGPEVLTDTLPSDADDVCSIVRGG